MTNQLLGHSQASLSSWIWRGWLLISVSMRYSAAVFHIISYLGLIALENTFFYTDNSQNYSTSSDERNFRRHGYNNGEYHGGSLRRGR